MTRPTIGFIGLGEMGRPMASRLLEAGYAVLGCAHRRREAIEALKIKGLTECANPSEVAKAVDLLVTMVVDQAQTDVVLRGPNGALAKLRSNSIVVVMSTVDPEYCRALEAEARARSIDVIDCPVTGAVARAEKGTLALIAGGDPAVLDRCRSPLEVMGNIHHCGPVGMGMVVKLANNAIAFATVQLVAEARAFASTYNVDMNVLMSVCRSGTADSFVVQAWDWIAANMPNLLPLGLKDARICHEAALGRGVPMPMLSAYLSQHPRAP